MHMSKVLSELAVILLIVGMVGLLLMPDLFGA